MSALTQALAAILAPVVARAIHDPALASSVATEAAEATSGMVTQVIVPALAAHDWAGDAKAAGAFLRAHLRATGAAPATAPAA